MQCKVFTKPLRLHFSAVKGAGVISEDERLQEISSVSVSSHLVVGGPPEAAACTAAC